MPPASIEFGSVRVVAPDSYDVRDGWAGRTGSSPREPGYAPGVTKDAIIESILLERDGVYSWHLPEGVGERSRAIEPEPRTVRFEIDLQPTPAATALPREGRTPRTDRTRGLLGDLIGGASR